MKWSFRICPSAKRFAENPNSATSLSSGTAYRNNRRAAASMELVLASAVAIPIAGGLLFLGFQICRYVFAALVGLISMPFV